ncbi:hypothetical protein ACLIYN_14520, partial [Streptomyces atacamensis]
PRQLTDRHGRQRWLQVDGWGSPSAIERCAVAGAGVYVAGSGVYGADDRAAAVRCRTARRRQRAARRLRRSAPAPHAGRVRRARRSVRAAVLI